jgi:hypothetical protein
MLEQHNPDAIQKYGWSQIQPIQLQIVTDVLSKSTDVAKAILKVIDRYDSFALLIVKNMSANIANNLANINGIEYLT